MPNTSADLIHTPAWSSRFPDTLVVAESTRLGGVSEGAYASLNLSLYTDDDPAAVAENRRRFAEVLGLLPAQFAGAHQVHEQSVLRVHQPGQWEGYDAFITKKKGILLTVTVADCTPVLLYDPVQQAVGAAHAGWRGTAAGIAALTLQAMRDAFGTQARHCWAYIGTCIGAQDYEVDADVAEQFPAAHRRWDEVRAKFLLDLKGANRQQLLTLGLPAEQIELSPYSTASHLDRYFSHRAEKGRTGRMLGAIGLR